MRFNVTCNYVGFDTIAKGDRSYGMVKVITPDGGFTFFVDNKMKLPAFKYLESVECEVLLINSSNGLRARLLSVTQAK